MAVREHWEIKWIQWIAVQEDWVTVVSTADTVNIVWWGTVTDVGWVATINIPQWVEWYREDVTAWSATYTFVHSPATDTSFLVFTDSGTLMFLWIDYTYDSSTETITFLSLGANEAAYIWVAHALVNWGWIGDMVKAVYDPTNINSSAFDMDNFIDGTNKHYVTTQEKSDISTALQPNDNISELTNDVWYITGINSTDIATALWYTPWDVVWPASSTDWNIVVFDGVTCKLIKDSGLNIQVVTTQPTWDLCSVYYDNWTIYLYTSLTPVLTDAILLEDGYGILLEDWDVLWVEDWVTPPPADNNIQLENSDNLITENSDNLVLES